MELAEMSVELSLLGHKEINGDLKKIEKNPSG